MRLLAFPQADEQIIRCAGDSQYVSYLGPLVSKWTGIALVAHVGDLVHCNYGFGRELLWPSMRRKNPRAKQAVCVRVVGR